MGMVVVVIIIVIGVYFLSVTLAKNRVERQEREKAANYPSVTTERIIQSLTMFFLTKDSKDVSDYFKNDVKNLIFAKSYIIDNGIDASNTFLAVKENLKHDLNYDYIYPNTMNVERLVENTFITERMYFYNNSDCRLVLTIISNDRYNKGHHRIIIALEKNS